MLTTFLGRSPSSILKLTTCILLLITLGLLIALNPGISRANLGGGKSSITLVLDWTPNTNHSGIVIAQKLGYYAHRGLDVKIVQPSKNSAEYMVARGMAQIGISSESNLIEAITKGMPLISVATIIAHDTSGFYSLAAKHIITPKDFEGKTYGGWGSDFEIATIKAMMSQAGADFKKLKIVTIGSANFFNAKNIDFVWGFSGWTGIEAQILGKKVNFIKVRTTLNLDGFTPVIITSSSYAQHNPQLMHQFMAATHQGYEFAIKHPQEAAKILLTNYPELKKDLVIGSTKFLAPRYQEDSPYWGYQKPATWEHYLKWMLANGVIKRAIPAKSVYTNEFLKPCLAHGQSLTTKKAQPFAPSARNNKGKQAA